MARSSLRKILDVVIVAFLARFAIVISEHLTEPKSCYVCAGEDDCHNKTAICSYERLLNTMKMVGNEFSIEFSVPNAVNISEYDCFAITKMRENDLKAITIMDCIHQGMDICKHNRENSGLLALCKQCSNNLCNEPELTFSKTLISDDDDGEKKDVTWPSIGFGLSLCLFIVLAIVAIIIARRIC